MAEAKKEAGPDFNALSAATIISNLQKKVDLLEKEVVELRNKVALHHQTKVVGRTEK